MPKKSYNVPALVNGDRCTMVVTYDGDSVSFRPSGFNHTQAFTIDSLRQIVQQYDDNQVYDTQAKTPDPNDA